jgi:predicted molibdopterin-dependent oxidoreductase YjgC
MFRRLHEDAGAPVRITVDGREAFAREGDSVAAALLAAGCTVLRTTPVSGTPRAPYCMIGACFDCLVTIDGVGSRQACLARVREGMAIATQRGRRELGR